MNTMKAVLLAVLVTGNPGGSGADAAAARETTGASPRDVILLNDGWMYLEEEVADVGGLNNARTAWRPVRLPHTWNRDDVMDVVPGYRRGIGWYRRTLRPPAGNRGDRLLLYFEGVNMKADVFVNGRRAGGHVGGYLGFEVDITPFVKPGGSATIAVKADNGIDPDLIPSQKSDFFLYGGITRNVWLRRVPARSIGGVRIRTPHVSRERAVTRVDVPVVSATDAGVDGRVQVDILDPAGATVASATAAARLGRGTTMVPVSMPEIPRPSLWAPAHPALYRARVTLFVAGVRVDSSSERFGLRWFEFAEHGPFFLNGERLLLRGTHRHEEWSGLGNALPDSLHRREMRMIREMGANFVRLAHYPQSPEVYRACDELGLLVWDELPWCRGGMGGATWKSNTERLLTEMIGQNANHPSIIIWSLGNELDWLPDFPGGDNTDSLRAMLGRLNAIAHRLDSSRVTATRRFDEGADLVDVHSSSIWMGWYAAAAGYENYGKAITDARRKFKRFFHAEYGGDSHVGRHTEVRIGGDGTLVTPKGKQKMTPVAKNGDWSESYIVDLFDWYLKTSEQSDSLTGTAQWIFKDFGTPLRPENPIPYVNQKGLCDLAGNPKDAYYVFKSFWTENPEFCYIESRTWTERSGPPGVKRDVRVYSNCAEVELFLDGKSQGRRRKDSAMFPASGLVWQVDFAEGPNSLVAVGMSGAEQTAADTLLVRYTHEAHGPADDLRLSASMLPDGNILVTAVAVDKDGRNCADYNKRVYFSQTGAGRLLSGYGTPTRSCILEMANGRAAIEYVPGAEGEGTIEVRNQDLKGSYINVGAGKVPPAPGIGAAHPKRLRMNED